MHPMNLISEALTLGWQIRREVEAQAPNVKEAWSRINSQFGGSWHGELLPVPRDLLEALSREIASSGDNSLKEAAARQTQQLAESAAKIAGEAAYASVAPKKAGGLKLDEGKLELWDLLSVFPRAFLALARHAQWGVSVGNRGWGNQRHVEDGDRRYRNGFLRHVFEEIRQPGSLDEYGKEHWPAILWNAMEIVEREEIKKEAQTQREGLLQAAASMGCGIVGQNLSGSPDLKKELAHPGEIRYQEPTKWSSLALERLRQVMDAQRDCRSAVTVERGLLWGIYQQLQSEMGGVAGGLQGGGTKGT